MVLVPRPVAAVALAAAALASACSALLTVDPTPVPGAAATLTRASRTPIPTSITAPASPPVVSPVASRAAVSAASPGAASQPASDDDVRQVQSRFEQILATPDLPGVDALLLDHVSLSTADGGQVLGTPEASAWLRSHAGPGLKVSRLERGSLTVMLEVLTTGWPARSPLSQGQVSFSLRRYDPAGRPDEDSGDWKIDVISAE